MIRTKGIPKPGDFVIEPYGEMVYRFLVKKVTEVGIHVYFCIQTNGTNVKITHDNVYAMVLYDRNSKILRPE